MKKQRKPRSDKNKRRKHPHRAYNGDQNLLLVRPTINFETDFSQENLNSQNPENIAHPPPYDEGKDYYKEFYKLYLQNENLLADIDQTATDNYRVERKIFNIKDFYDTTLIPQIMTQPHKFLHRLRQQQYQKQLQINVQENQVKNLTMR